MSGSRETYVAPAEPMVVGEMKQTLIAYSGSYVDGPWYSSTPVG